MKKGLGNPAAVALLSTPQGQKVIEKTSHATGRAIDIGITIFKVGLLSLVAYIAYRKITGAFSKIKEDSNYRPANISIVSAKQRAENLFKAMYGVGANFEKVKANLTIPNQKLNYNGYLRIYNEFGSRRGSDFKKLTLTEWLIDQFGSDNTKMAQLKFLTNNVF
jgi:hypothetical protein